MDREVTSASHDDATNQRLRLLVGLVVVSGGTSLAMMTSELPLSRQQAGFGAVFAALIAISMMLGARIRVGATRFGLAPTSAVVLVGTAFLPPGWVVLSTAAGVLAATLIMQLRPIKIAYNVGKETLAASAAVGAALLVGMPPLPTEPPQPIALRLFGLAVAAVGYTLIDEVCAIPLGAIVTRTSLRQRALAHLDVRATGLVIAFLAACVTVWAYSLQPLLVFALPLVVLGLHVTSANQMRARTEREAWQRLAQATDELNTVDLDRVTSTAVIRAAELFSADEVDLEIRTTLVPARLIRGSSRGVTFDGPPQAAPVVAGHVIETGLDGYGGNADLGTLRLRFLGKIELSERERYTLRTFAAALFTSIRNATTFAETRRLAIDHARVAAQDPLTGLANRRRLLEYGEQVLAERTPDTITALLLIDLNHFKEVNETLGHAAGDQLLVEVSQRLAATVGVTDMVARLGGDEFAVLFVGLVSPSLALAKAHAVLSALSVPMDLDGMRLGVEASGGVATTPIPDVRHAGTSGIVELMRRADIAMYHAKRDGRRIATYARSHDTASVGSLTLGGDLARAIAERQFVVDFQPIVDLTTGETIAAEALARWNHPERGYLGPAKFLDAIERSGQLPGFADLVLDLALAAVKEWMSEGFGLTVAVNCSARSLLDPSFPDAIAAGLSRHGLAAETLVIELTESATLSQLQVVDEVLEALRGLGVRLALDDFGTGFSSLSTIARVPVHELKIDRSFVSAMDSPASGAVVRSTIELARSLDLLVVAEGIETEEQRRLLWELGCPAGQGHLFARPVASNRLLAMLRRGADGRRGTMAAPIHEAGSVIRMPQSRRGKNPGQQRLDQGG